MGARTLHHTLKTHFPSFLRKDISFLACSQLEEAKNRMLIQSQTGKQMCLDILQLKLIPKGCHPSSTTGESSCPEVTKLSLCPSQRCLAKLLELTTALSSVLFSTVEGNIIMLLLPSIASRFLKLMPAWDNWWESAVLHCPVQTWQEQGTQALISTLPSGSGSRNCCPRAGTGA